MPNSRDPAIVFQIVSAAGTIIADVKSSPNGTLWVARRGPAGAVGTEWFPAHREQLNNVATTLGGFTARIVTVTPETLQGSTS